MKHMIIRTFVEEVDQDKNLGTAARPFYAVKRGVYRLERRVDMGPGGAEYGYASVREFVRCARSRKLFHGWVRNGYRHNLPTCYGIKSYQEVTLEEV